MATSKFNNLPTEDPKPTLSVPEAARHLSVSPGTVRKLVKTGELRASKLGTRVIIHRNHLDRLLDDNRI